MITTEAKKSIGIDSNALIQRGLSDFALIIDAELDRLLPKNSSNLMRAIRYSCLELKGKKIRPFLFTEVAKVLSIGLTKDVISIAAVLELIHVYSLIHDDLPAMDNDDLRRGKASCHKKFDEATAILAGDALLSYAFEVLSECTQIPALKRLALISALAKTIGFHGMVKGQYADMEYKGKSIPFEEILVIHKLKTGKLINFSCEAAAIIAGCSQEAQNALKVFSDNFGLLFQITDDLLDFKANSKPDECNVVTELGTVKTQELMDDFAKRAISALELFGAKADDLKSLVRFTLNRQA